ncbi:MAG: metal ABC transporter substrate-binding protein [Clostridiales bacterium]|uniref:metal ABC transporter substrate-binding protein n=1 Tax=Hornefia butyriciproducens TaxID=2652293 RepID=UPI002A7576AC|nr:metal ABC transporter substrate-binding protein [Hornefia butyriciproducens]MCI7679714.1 metal ABC transporter substrate-binding protein [Clostridiales bacterium]MDY2991054.1 metal ABC transporter substrate-binding protein [Hornefia butyriciproducens]
MKKTAVILLAAVVFVVAALSGCAKDSGNSESKTSADSKKIKIVTTIFPEYDWVTQILGSKADQAEVTMLLDNGVDLHSYQPTTEDIAKVKSCDLFIYVGGESDEWVSKALKDSTNKKMKVINLLDVLGDSVKEEESKEGMMPEKEEEEDGSDEPEYDEHVWLSLKNAKVLTKAVAKEIEALDPENANTYGKNEAEYLRQLSALDEKYKKAVRRSAGKTLVVGDRFPFRYMVDDYGLEYYAAFAGCSAETEASFKTISFLAKKVDKLKLKNIATIEGSDRKIARTIIKNTGKKSQHIVTLDSMQSTTSEDVEKGKTYLGVMTANLGVLKKALQREE